MPPPKQIRKQAKNGADEATEATKTARAKKPSKNRTKLLAIAREFFVERGYADTSTEDLVKAANITRGALYYQFGDKKDLFRALVKEITSEMATQVHEETMARITSDIDDLLVGSEVILEVYCRPDVKQVVLLDAPVVLGYEEWKSLQEPMLLYFTAHSLQHLVDEGFIEQASLEPLVQLISGALIRAALAIGQATSPQRTAKQYKEGLLTLYRGVLK